MKVGFKQCSMFNWSLSLMAQTITYESGGLAALLTRPQDQDKDQDLTSLVLSHQNIKF